MLSVIPPKTGGHLSFFHPQNLGGGGGGGGRQKTLLLSDAFISVTLIKSWQSQREKEKVSDCFGVAGGGGGGGGAGMALTQLIHSEPFSYKVMIASGIFHPVTTSLLCMFKNQLFEVNICASLEQITFINDSYWLFLELFNKLLYL